MEKDSPKSYDPTPLSQEERDLIRRMIGAKQSGADVVDDDPIARDLVKGYIKTISESIEKSGCNERILSPEQKERLLSTLKVRFEANMKRHEGIEWSKVEARLNKADPEKLRSLNKMEETGGEPDVVGFVKDTGEYEFFDCSAESPKGRRDLCYDREGQEEAERRGRKPAGNAVDMAKAMGIEILTEEQYRKLQKLSKFDKNTWSWTQTPNDARKAGVALSGYRRNDFVYVRGDFPCSHGDHGAFRGWLRV